MLGVPIWLSIRAVGMVETSILCVSVVSFRRTTLMWKSNVRTLADPLTYQLSNGAGYDGLT